MVFRDRVIGVLYHTTVFSSAFKKSDLEPRVFAARRDFLDNANAYEEIHRLNQKLMEEKGISKKIIIRRSI